MVDGDCSLVSGRLLLISRPAVSSRFAFHEVLAARTYQAAGRDAENYAVRCYSVAMLEYEAGQWGNIKVGCCLSFLHMLHTFGFSNCAPPPFPFECARLI
jgi:hypothetical protein